MIEEKIGEPVLRLPERRQDHLRQVIKYLISRTLSAHQSVHVRHFTVFCKSIQRRTRQIIVNGVECATSYCNRIRLQIVDADPPSYPGINRHKLSAHPSSPSAEIWIRKVNRDSECLFRINSGRWFRQSILQGQPSD